MEKRTSAAELIRRFREAKPTSRLERISNRNVGNIGELWWKNEGEDTNGSGSLSSNLFESGNKSLVSNMGVGEIPVQFKSIEDMIANDIRQLEMTVNTQSRSSLPRRHQQSKVPATSLAGFYSTAAARDSRLYVNSSYESIGHTGYRGLLDPEMKLDGIANANDKVGGTIPGDVNKINEDLEALLKSLGIESNKNEFDYNFPDLAANIASISQVSEKLLSDLSGFTTYYEKKHAQEQQEEKERLEKEQQLIEEGRRAEREAREMLCSIPTDSLDYVGLLRELDEELVDEEEAHAKLRSETDMETEAKKKFEKRVPKRVFDAESLSSHDVRNLSLAEAAELSRRMCSRDQPLPSDAMTAVAKGYRQSLRFKLRERLEHTDAGAASRLKHSERGRWGSRTSLLSTAGVHGSRESLVSVEHSDDEDPSGSRAYSSRRCHWNPYPEFVHNNILSTDMAIISSLNSAMQTLHLRIPSEETQQLLNEWKRKRDEAEKAVPPAEAPSTSTIDAATSTNTDYDFALGDIPIEGVSLPPDPAADTPRRVTFDDDVSSSSAASVRAAPRTISVSPSAMTSFASAAAAEDTPPIGPVTAAELQDLEAVLGPESQPTRSTRLLDAFTPSSSKDVGLSPGTTVERKATLRFRPPTQLLDGTHQRPRSQPVLVRARENQAPRPSAPLLPNTVMIALWRSFTLAWIEIVAYCILRYNRWADLRRWHGRLRQRRRRSTGTSF